MNILGDNVLWTSFAAAAPAAPGASGQGVAQSTTVPGAEGTVQEGGEAVASGPFGDNFFMILILVMVAVVGFSMLSQRKEKKRRAALLSSIGKNDTVQTIGGMIGRVVELKPDRAVLEVDRNSGSRVTVSRQALQQVLETSESGGGEDTDGQ
ncbi:MAG: preprotein translocase subunit YajC [Phycisphaerales bacterium]|jgi:preprotein translocase subunit YajC|nr:preprotein translocase subunit YajC [Phycisphaerales bacterium]